MSKVGIILLAVSTLLCAEEAEPWTRKSSKKSFAVVAYLPEWRFESANYDVICNYSTHLIFFSVEPDHKGGIVGLDRFPPPDVLIDARRAADLHGCKLMICFGGNGRSSGFSKTVRNKISRQSFVKDIKKMLKKYNFDGVDINWEYPGYLFGQGYLSEEEIEKDYKGLILFLKSLRKALGDDKIITMAYYPDQRQERLLLQGGGEQYVDLMHMMTYDQSGGHHSSFELAVNSVKQAVTIGLNPKRLTLGLPFYGRHTRTGDWVTYEDIVQREHPLDPSLDYALQDKSGAVGFNGIDQIVKKVELSLKEGIAGVMIWEVGQDCRIAAVNRFGRTHAVTCPNGEDSSLLVAIYRTLIHSGVWSVNNGENLEGMREKIANEANLFSHEDF